MWSSADDEGHRHVRTRAKFAAIDSRRSHSGDHSSSRMRQTLAELYLRSLVEDGHLSN